MDKTVAALVKELAKLSTEVASDKDLANVASVSAGGNAEIGQLIADAMAKVGRQGVVTMEESKTAEDNLFFVEGMQFDRGYYSPYFVTDPERMVAEYENCRCVRVRVPAVCGYNCEVRCLRYATRVASAARRDAGDAGCRVKQQSL
eukprot:GHRQ01037861.1.p1 GENE.GHRQ01037861.1~~GHRQ01037861.1.p1  ORF type:complete len:146 (-),score=59.06 GHRQ01037861.1:218-655(-)